MKFTAGYWEMRPEVTARFPVEVHEVQTDPEGMTIHATTQKLVHRGDTLNQFPISMRFSSPLANVIRVQIYHHKGRRVREPQFALYPQAGPLVIEEGEEAATLTSGQLTARVAKTGPWSVEFRDGERVVTSSGWRGAAFMDTPQGRFAVEQLNLGVGECVYGLGERFTPFVKNGQVVDLWHDDGGTSSELAYKNIPFYMTNRGYGVFVNHPELVSFEIASEKVERVQFSVRGRAARLLPDRRPHAQGGARPLHRPDRSAGAAAAMVVWTVAEHLVYHVVRRRDRHELYPGHGGSQYPPACLPLRLLLDEGV